MTIASDCQPFDDPMISAFLFHPRAESPQTGRAQRIQAVTIPVGGEIAIGGRFQMVAPNGANLLFFHGNGEIAADYDDLGPVYNQLGINFMPVDYRGYGRSGGKPSVSAMLEDSSRIFDFCRTWLIAEGYTGPLLVMGRSLGSASALTLADRYPDLVRGLIIESGFADVLGLMRVLGIDPQTAGIQADTCFRHTQKIATFKNPLLVIHATLDHIIPFADGKALFAASRSPYKRFLEIPHADHNNLMAVGAKAYFEFIQDLIAHVRNHTP